MNMNWFCPAIALFWFKIITDIKICCQKAVTFKDVNVMLNFTMDFALLWKVLW